jgi:hypothetical protein
MSYHFLLRCSKVKPLCYITIVSDIIFLNNNCKFKKSQLGTCVLTGVHPNSRILNPPQSKFSYAKLLRPLRKEGRQSSLIVKG